MKKSYKVGNIVIAFALVAGIAVFAVENPPAKSSLIRLKVDGETVAELRLLRGDTLSLEGGSQMIMTNSQRVVTKNATLRYGYSRDKSFTVKADEAEIFAGTAAPFFAVEAQKPGPSQKLITLISNGAAIAELRNLKDTTLKITGAEQVQMAGQIRTKGGVTLQIKRGGGSPVTVKVDEIVVSDAN